MDYHEKYSLFTTIERQKIVGSLEFVSRENSVIYWPLLRVALVSGLVYLTDARLCYFGYCYGYRKLCQVSKLRYICLSSS